jgi:hypothetical protein
MHCVINASFFGWIYCNWIIIIVKFCIWFKDIVFSHDPNLEIPASLLSRFPELSAWSVILKCNSYE